MKTNSGTPRESRTRWAWMRAMSSATPCSGWQVVKAWMKHGAAILQAVENGAVELGRVGHGNLRDEGRAVAGEEGFGDGFLLGVLALRGRAEDVHVVAAEHGGGVGVLAAGVGVDLRVEHEDLDVGAVLQNDLGDVLIADVAHAAVAADGPDLGQFDDFLIGHQRVGEVAEVVVLARRR